MKALIYHIDKREYGTWVRGNYHAMLGWVGYLNRFYSFSETIYYIKQAMKTIKISSSKYALSYAPSGYYIIPKLKVKETRVGDMCIASPIITYSFIYYIR